MESKFLGALCLIALTGSSLAGIATYTYNPYTVAAATTYAAAPVLHQVPHAAVYSAAPVAAPLYTRSFVPATTIVKSAPVIAPAAIKTYAAAAPVVPAVRTVGAPAAVVRQVEVESSPRYDFSYGVHDSITGDIKSQVESRDGGNVAGSYSVVDADGFKRTVTYTADDINGFNAIVQREPIVLKSTAAAAVPLSLPVARAVQPLAAVRFAAPIATVHAPVSSFAAPIVAAQPALLQQQQPQYQYIPQAQQPTQGGSDSETIEAPQQQPESEPAPVEYPDQQQQQQQQQQLEQQQQQALEQQQQQQQQEQFSYPQNQQFPPYPQFELPAQQGNTPSNQPESDDSDIVEARSTSNSATETSVSSTAAPAAVVENQNEADQTEKKSS